MSFAGIVPLLAQVVSGASKMDDAIASMQGAWDGQRVLRGLQEEVRFIVRPDGVWLEVQSRANAGSVKLSPQTMERDGGVLFTFPPQASQVRSSPYNLNPPSLTAGRVRVLLNADARTGSRRVYLQFPQTPESKFYGPTVVLSQQTAPSSGPEKTILEKFPRFHAYADWRTKDGAAGPGAEDRLRAMLGKLKALPDGWTCLQQFPFTVTADKVSKLTFTERGEHGMYVIYAPSGDPSLTYGFASSSAIGATLHGQTFDYPFLQTYQVGVFAIDLTVSLYLRPAGPANAREAKEVPAIVFALQKSRDILGNLRSDNGPRCAIENGR